MWRLASFTLGVALLLASQSRPALAAAASPLEGVWQVVDVNGQRAAGVYIFTGTHYSMMFTVGDRPDVDTNKATADELRAVWGPMAANAGVFEINGDQVTIRPIVAKIPVVMKPGAYEVYAFRIEGNKLFLTQVRNVRGPVEHGNAITLMRVE
ncbi:MAG TPA: hypothetical protein VG297_09310 [Bryobacteraceae bacterium]|jgi:hypothetical protein|nr:hypothetical protein [Bryobacteraceae bacterium]